MTTREQAVQIASLPRAELIDRIEQMLDRIEQMLYHLQLAGKFKPAHKILGGK